MITIRPTGGALLWLLLVLFCLLFSSANAQDCSALNQCATGCCNKGGYCGIGDDYCGSNCVANCDYEPECSVSKPCASGCCNKYGYCGLGPDFCADKQCVGNCDRKSECDPDDYGDYAESSKCPLNVCCSKFGFCGTTEEFCGKKKVKRPSCSKDGSLNRVVGYYEGWSPSRPCHAFYPEQIPVGIYTHLNYAFASIDPVSFEIVAATESEKSLMKRLTDLKKIDSGLKVFIAIGGWTFNDPGATQTVFSDIAASVSNQNKFIRSLQSFMSTYNFDGVDLDWEYPVTDDRGGKKKDFDNFPKFLANLKRSLKSTGGRDGVSITLPASYWYLQHFDIANLQKHVDFFNIMTYDLHGKWDLGSEWVSPVLDSHTNLTEITNALDLLWRNDIKSDKVVLGLAFYARVFTAANPSCMEPGCLFVSGGNAGKCSHEVGILLNSEIMDIMDKNTLQSKLDKEAAVKILKFDDNQWLTYDNGDAFELKADFARSQCLGGVMVWAVSHDLPQGNFSRALGKAVGREAKSLDNSEEAASMQVQKSHPQCKWTNCFEDCPSGWSRVRRTDDGARGGEHMWDGTACSLGQHTFCCPPDAELPKCGWYTHNNGKCNSQCPSGYTEVGSNIEYCSNSNDYQAACCTTDTPSMKLYSKCDWAGKPRKCDEECPSGKTEVALSTTGSGGVYCEVTAFKYTMNGNEGTDWESRSYCCNEEDDVKWSKCTWRDDIGLMDDKSYVDGYCRPGCPDDHVRVAIDQHGGGCKGDGGRAKCCLPEYSTVSKRSYTTREQDLDDLVKGFMDDPSCGLDDYTLYSAKRDLAGFGFSMGNTSLSDPSDTMTTLQRRATTKQQDAVYTVIASLAVQLTANAAYREIWTNRVVSVYKHLTVSAIRAYLTTSNWVEGGTENQLQKIICAPSIYNGILAKESVVSCECETSDCCDPNDPDSCSEIDDDWDDDDSTALRKRVLDKRSERTYPLNLQDGGQNVMVASWQYVDRINIQTGDPILDEGYEYDDYDNCLNTQVGIITVPVGSIARYQIEHVVELTTPVQFLRDAALGIVRSGGPMTLGRISVTFARQALIAPVLVNPPVMTGADQSLIPIRRVMHALGSLNNEADFNLLFARLNNVKSRVWRLKTIVADRRMKNAIEATDPKQGLIYLREPLTVITYLNHLRVQPGMISTLNTVREEFGRADAFWVSAGNPDPRSQARWDEWIRDLLDSSTRRVREFVENWGEQMYKYWAVRTGTKAQQTLEIIQALRRQAGTARINRHGLD